MKLTTTWVQNWQPEFVGTLLFIVHNGQVLLIHKKTGHGAGRINGPGGKLEPGEGVVACAVREVYEEVGLEVHDAEVGVEMRFVERNGPQWLGFALRATRFSGTPVETAEARPFWCPLSEVPYEQMWPDDAVWLPGLLESVGNGTAVYDFLFDNERLLAHELVPAASIWEMAHHGPENVS